MMTTAQVRAALRNHYPANEYALLWEVGNATGSGVRRWADAVVMNLWPSRGLTMTGIEIKVSRSDWVKELKTPEKAEAIAKFCDFWCLVTPENIVHEHELPFSWGHMIVNPKGAVRIAKKPDKLEAEPMTRGFLAALLRRSSEVDASEVNALVDRQIAKERESIESKVAQRVAQETRKFAEVQKKVSELKELGLDLRGWEDSAYIAKCYETGRRFIQSHTALTDPSLTSRLENLLDIIGKVRDDLDMLNSSRKD